MCSSTALGKRIATRITLVSAALISVSAFLHSQQYQDSWRWTSFQIGDEQTPNRVFDVIETNDGTAWAIMDDGLRWSVGFEWNSIDGAQGLPHRRPLSVTPLSDSSILVSIGSDLYVGGTYGFQRLKIIEGRRTFGIVSAAVLQSGAILALDSLGVLWEAHSPFETFESSRIENTPAGAYWIWNSRPGSVWLLASDGIFHLRDSRFELRFKPPKRVAIGSIIRENHSGEGIARIHLIPAKAVVCSFGPKGSFSPLQIENDDLTETIDITPDGTRIVTYVFGAVQLRSPSGVRFLNQVPRQMRNLLFLRSRDNGELWAGSETGLSLYQSRSSWSYWKRSDVGLWNQVADIIRTPDGSFWIANGIGIEVRRSDGSVQLLKNALGISLAFATGMAVDREGNVWIGSGGGFAGALRWDGKRWLHFGQAQGLGAQNIHKIRLDRQGRLWFMGIAPYIRAQHQFDTEVGAFVLDNGRFKRWGVEEGLVNGRVYAMANGPDGAYWFGTAGGISRWKDNAWRHWKLEEGLLSRRVFSMDVDARGDLWFADQASGVGHIDSLDRVSYQTTAQGLLSNSVWEVKFDDEGTLWCATVGGLASYRNGVWSRFDFGTGLTSLRLWPILFANDKVYVGSLDGGVAILDKAAAHAPAPKIVLSRPVVESNTALVRWSVYPYWGEVPSEDVEIRYQLDEGGWSTWQKSRERAFIDLSSGSHTVTVQTKNLFGMLGPETSILIAIPRPWYRSTAFLLLVALIGLALVVQRSFYLNRRRVQQRMLEDSERRYRSLFEDSPLSIWEEDITDVIRAFDELRARGTIQLRSYLEEHPKELARIAQLIRIVDVNKATVMLYKAESKEQLLHEYEMIRTKPPGEYMRQLLGRIADSVAHYEAEVAETTITGEPMYTLVRTSIVPGAVEGRTRMIVIVMDVSDRRKNQRERENLIANLEEALASVKTLRGLIPICSSCKKIRDDNGYWNFLEQYIMDHSDAVISHGLCPDCAKRLYPDVFNR